MKKHKLIFGISLLLVLSACQPTVNVEQKPEEIVGLDRTTANYTVEEIELPHELQFEEDSSLLFELEQSEGFQFKVSVLDRSLTGHSLKRITPTANVFDYDLSTNEVTSNPITVDFEYYRLQRYVKDKFDGSYEILDLKTGGNTYNHVFYNGTLVDEVPNNIASSFNRRGFQELNGNIYIFTEVETSKENQSIWTIYELNQGKAEVVYQLENERFITVDMLNGGSKLAVPPSQENSKDRMAFVIVREDEKLAQVFDGNELIEFPLDDYPISMVPLKDYVLFFNQVIIDDLNDKSEFPLYKYDIKTKEVKLLETLDYELGMTYQTQGNEFYQVTSDDRSIGVCKVDDEDLKCRKIEEVLNNRIVSSIETLDEKTDLIHVRDIGTMKSHIYLIHWE